MLAHFKILLSDEVDKFLKELDEKTREKIFYNIDKARQTLDPKLFKKLTIEIWEFRTRFQSKQYRLFAFWDKTDNKNTLVVTTHAFIKKTQKTPKSEIEKAMAIREMYYKNR